jgi:hypothetical protein
MVELLAKAAPGSSAVDAIEASGDVVRVRHQRSQNVRRVRAVGRFFRTRPGIGVACVELSSSSGSEIGQLAA